ncbi:hypothetical protein BGW38_006145 [Lunasporangiospora selenospora]|uniref:Uncharacterized protein n=1 Tax=Lunasporangiospora selenospora TaxID=979761 RepID=A0A9P6FM67_9FUNG|nr:hypothetical protein BGW38_006145 [Lunasporangiospora selenospora]
MLEYCESPRGKEQLAFLESFTAFQVVSDHLAVNAGSYSANQLKLHSAAAGVKTSSRSLGNHDADDTPRSTLTEKKHRLDQSDDDDSALQSSQNPKQPRRVSFGRNLSLEDSTPGYSSPKDGDVRDKPIPGSLQSSIGSSLPSTDKDDASYCTDQDLRESISKIYTWNYFEGNGRIDSHVDTAWIINDTDVGHDLMDFRDRVVQENGGLTEPHEKL